MLKPNNKSLELALLVALTHCVRAFTREQIHAEFFLDEEQKQKESQLADYVKRGLLISRSILVRQLSIPSEPLFVWSIGEASPNFEKLVAKVRSRWSNVPTKRTRIYMRGPVATQLLGGVPGSSLKRPLHVSHDIGVAGVYLATRRSRPEIAKYWYGEDLTAGMLPQIPDALYINEHGVAALAIEFCGLYVAKRYKKFHEFCVAKDLPYEFW